MISRNARSSMVGNLVHLLQEGAIIEADLVGFSDELIERAKFLAYNGWKEPHYYYEPTTRYKPNIHLFQGI